MDSYLYLGVKLNYNNRFKVAQKDLFQRASRAMFALLKRCNTLMLPIDVKIELFDKTILPILTYGSEVWAFDMSDLARKLQLKFLKLILGLRQSTPTMIVYGETGCLPVDVAAKSRMLCYWFRLCTYKDSSKLSNIIYRYLYKLYQANAHVSEYIAVVKKTLEDLGLSGIWKDQGNAGYSEVWFKGKVKRCLADHFIQQWYSELDNNTSFTNYTIFCTFG